MTEFVKAHSDVNDDLFIREAHLVALVDSRVYVHVPNRATIHEDVAFEMLGRENSGNRT